MLTRRPAHLERIFGATIRVRQAGRTCSLVPPAWRRERPVDRVVGFVVSKAVGRAVVTEQGEAPTRAPGPGATRVAAGLCCARGAGAAGGRRASYADLAADLDRALARSRAEPAPVRRAS